MLGVAQGFIEQLARRKPFLDLADAGVDAGALLVELALNLGR
jgi:hypothetical protein